MDNVIRGNFGFDFVTYRQFKLDYLLSLGYEESEALALSKKEDMDSFILSIYENIPKPRRSTNYSSGYDVFSPVDFTLNPTDEIIVPTGILCEMPPYVWAMAIPRSGLGFKGLALYNTVGNIDADYSFADNEGHIKVKFRNDGKQPIQIKKGTAFFQIVIVPYFTFENEIKPNKIRTGGFGSTDEKRD